MRKINVVQIGIGHDHAPMVFESLKKLNQFFDIKGYCLPENEREKFNGRLSIFDGYNELSIDEVINGSNVDAVVIETEEENLTKYAIMSAKAKKHIHMDKPGSMSLPDFEELVNIVKNNKKVFHLGYMYRYNPEIQKLLKSVSDGELGEIYAVEAHMSNIFPQTKEKKQWLEKFKGGMMFFLGGHIVDIVLSIQGLPEKIIPLNKCTGLDGVTSEDYGMAIFEYKNGISFVKTCASEIGGGARRQIVVCGSKKTVEIKPIEIIKGDDVSTVVTHYESKPFEYDKQHKSGNFNRYDNMLEGFSKYVSGEMANPWTYDYELSLYKCLLKSCGYEIQFK